MDPLGVIGGRGVVEEVGHGGCPKGASPLWLLPPSQLQGAEWPLHQAQGNKWSPGTETVGSSLWFLSGVLVTAMQTQLTQVDADRPTLSSCTPSI